MNRTQASATRDLSYVRLYEQVKRNAAIAIVQTDAGQFYMEEVRQHAAALQSVWSQRRDALSKPALEKYRRETVGHRDDRRSSCPSYWRGRGFGPCFEPSP